MNATTRDLDAPLESRIQNAVTDLRTSVFSSIHECANAWQVSKSHTGCLDEHRGLRATNLYKYF